MFFSNFNILGLFQGCLFFCRHFMTGSSVKQGSVCAVVSTDNCPVKRDPFLFPG